MAREISEDIHMHLSQSNVLDFHASSTERPVALLFANKPTTKFLSCIHRGISHLFQQNSDQRRQRMHHIARWLVVPMVIRNEPRWLMSMNLILPAWGSFWQTKVIRSEFWTISSTWISGRNKCLPRPSVWVSNFSPKRSVFSGFLGLKFQDLGGFRCVLYSTTFF